MTPPTVLLDLGFLEALADPSHPDGERAAAAYRLLLERSRCNERRLRARADHLRVVASDRAVRQTLFAPVEAIAVAGQHRRAAHRLELDDAISDDAALTLVVMRREKIAEIATFDDSLRGLDVAALP